MVGSIHRTVNIYDRHGELVDDISLPGSCTGLKWDAEGNTLAIIQVPHLYCTEIDVI